MPRTIQKVNTENKEQKPVKPVRPYLTPEAEEQHNISLAMELARKQLTDGTASSQVITHFLELASSRKKLEAELMVLQKELLKAKTDSLKSQKSTEKLYADAIQAFGLYAGNAPMSRNDNDEEDFDNERD
jgi:uncharacterized membrane-anchored protein YhcB (DUF1043 family)